MFSIARRRKTVLSRQELTFICVPILVNRKPLELSLLTSGIRPIATTTGPQSFSQLCPDDRPGNQVSSDRNGQATPVDRNIHLKRSCVSGTISAISSAIPIVATSLRAGDPGSEDEHHGPAARRSGNRQELIRDAIH